MTSLIEASCRYPRTILGTCCIPWSDAGQLEDGIFRDQIRLLVGQGLRDLYIFGTAGEGYAVSERQFDEIVSIFCAEMNALGAAPMVGLISLSLSTVIERIERAAEQGVRAFQCSLPSWGALSDREVRVFFQEVCGRFPNLNFLHYNLMRAGRVLTPREYAVLAQEHPNLVATKHGGASIEVIGALLREVPQVRHFLTEPGFAAGCTLDAHGKPGLLISLASSNPARAWQYHEAGIQGDAETLMALQSELMAMRDTLIATVMSAAHMDGAFDKIFSKLHDHRFPLRLLPPYDGASEAAFATYYAMLREQFPQWMPQRDN